ncbi:MAG: hypothetical protein KJZ74_06400 [Gemmatimonadales bacterium]|nr:hypothetical protein [Gemmatimonadales bacterium]
MSASRLGLAVNGDTVAIVRRERARGPEPTELRREPDESWTALIGRALGRGARRSLRRARLDVVVADSRCVAGPLFGEGVVSEQRDVARRFENDPQAYRIGDAGGLVGGNVWRENGAWYGVSLSRSLAEALVDACRQRRVELMTVRPAAGGGATLDALAAEACFARSGSPAVVDLLRAERTARRRRLVVRVAGTLALTGIALAVAVPALLARAELGTLKRELGEANATVYSLEMRERGSQGNRADAVRAVLRDRGSALGVIEALSRILPESAAVVSLRVDSTGGTLSVVAVRVAEAISRVTSESRFSNAVLAGAIVREEQEGVVLQRAVLSWRRREP